jgi:hypothetical protein
VHIIKNKKIKKIIYISFEVDFRATNNSFKTLKHIFGYHGDKEIHINAFFLIELDNPRIRANFKIVKY